MASLKHVVEKYIEIKNLNYILTAAVEQEAFVDEANIFGSLEQHILTLTTFLQQHEAITNIEDADLEIPADILSIIGQPEKKNIEGEILQGKIEGELDRLNAALKGNAHYDDIVKRQKAANKTTRVVGEIYGTENSFVKMARDFPLEQVIARMRAIDPNFLQHYPELAHLRDAFLAFENPIPLSINMILGCDSVIDYAALLAGQLNTDDFKKKHLAQILSSTSLTTAIVQMNAILIPRLKIIGEDALEEDVTFKTQYDLSQATAFQRLMRYPMLFNTLKNELGTLKERLPLAPLQETQDQIESLAERSVDCSLIGNDIKGQGQYLSPREIQGMMNVSDRIARSRIEKHEKLKQKKLAFLERKIGEIDELLEQLDLNMKQTKKRQKIFQGKIDGVQAFKLKLESLRFKVANNQPGSDSPSLHAQVGHCIKDAKRLSIHLSTKGALKDIHTEAKALDGQIQRRRSAYHTFNNENHFTVVQELKLRFLAHKIVQLDKRIDGYIARIEANDKKLTLLEQKREGLLALRSEILAMYNEISESPTYLHDVGVDFTSELTKGIERTLAAHKNMGKGFFSSTAKLIKKHLPGDAKLIDQKINRAIRDEAYAKRQQRDSHLLTEFEIPESLDREHAPLVRMGPL